MRKCDPKSIYHLYSRHLCGSSVKFQRNCKNATTGWYIMRKSCRKTLTGLNNVFNIYSLICSHETQHRESQKSTDNTSSAVVKCVPNAISAELKSRKMRRHTFSNNC